MLSSIAWTTRTQNRPSRTIAEPLCIIGVLALSAALNLWNLTANGWANAFYTAAVQSGLHNPEAFLFGSSDWGNSISVDKPPLSLWMMGLSVRIFGFNSFAILIPQALLGTATTALIYAILRRRASTLAALVAAFAFAITPIVVLLSRYNNPDPLMIFLMVAAVDAVLRGWESQRLRWFACTGAFLGLAFLTKQLQAFLVAPAISLVILAGLRSDWRNVLRAASVSAGGFLIFSATWLAVVDLTPAAQRPYVGGSQTNSLIELTLGYNGLNRVMDQANFSTAYIPQRFTSGNDVGLLRLFNANFGQESSWLLLLGLTSAPMIVWVFRRTSLAWHAVASSTWLVTTYLVLSFMGQDIHTYYTISLAPPLALTIGLTIEALRLRTMSVSRRVIISGGICLSTLSSWLTLNSLAAPEAQLLGLSALSLGLAGAALLAVPPPRAWINRVASTLAIVGLSVGPLATDLSTLSHAQTGSNPLSGSLTSSPTSMSRFLEEVRNNDPEWAHDTAFGAHPPTPAVELLLGSPPTCRWAAATLPAQTAANWQLASDKAIMPVGGFAATDPYPSFEEFKSLVLSGSICYYIDYPEMDPIATHQQTVTAILSWVRNTYAKETVEGVTIYKLAPKP